MYNVRFNGDEAIFENFQGEEIIINDNKDFDDPTVSEDITEFKGY